MDQIDVKHKPKKLLQCINWLENQNNKPQRRSVRDKKNDFNYIIQTSADSKKSLLSVSGDTATVPTGVGEPAIEPKFVPAARLRFDRLSMECEWLNCRSLFSNYDLFLNHVKGHVLHIHKIQRKSEVFYACLWDVCGHKTTNFDEMVRHINYHAYHSKLLAMGLNGRVTFKLARCKKDSRKRNILPSFIYEHKCMWTECEEEFDSIEIFFRHVKHHTLLTDEHLCSWAGCGARFRKRHYLQQHLQRHTTERVIACYHCGRHYSSYHKLQEHLLRQNVSPDSQYQCTMCGVRCANQYLLSEHTRQHVSAYVCALCDMTAPTTAALAHHVRYRHLAPSCSRVHACPHCPYRAISKFDLGKHILTHKKKKRNSDEDLSDDNEDMPGYDSDGQPKKKKKEEKQYACHLCPEKEMKIVSKGATLTQHLVKVHGAQWPSGHSRFRYQKSEDGLYRLTTTRYEVLEVFEKILDRGSGPKELLTNKFEFDLKQIADPTYDTPRRFEITFKGEHSQDTGAAEPDGGDDVDVDSKNGFDEEIVVKTENGPVNERHLESVQNSVEITMCDVDEFGNVIKSEVMYS